MLLINPQGGQTKIPWEQKRVTHPFGYTGIIIANQTYTITFDVPEKDLVDVTSMRATVYGLPQERYQHK